MKEELTKEEAKELSKWERKLKKTNELFAEKKITSAEHLERLDQLEVELNVIKNKYD